MPRLLVLHAMSLQRESDGVMRTAEHRKRRNSQQIPRSHPTDAHLLLTWAPLLP